MADPKHWRLRELGALMATACALTAVLFLISVTGMPAPARAAALALCLSARWWWRGTPVTRAGGLGGRTVMLIWAGVAALALALFALLSAG